MSDSQQMSIKTNKICDNLAMKKIINDRNIVNIKEFSSQHVDDEVKDASDGSKASLEDALSECGVGRYTYSLFILCTYFLLSAAIEIFAVGLIITTSQCDLNLDVWKKGIIGSVPMLGILMSAHLWGYIADTRGRRYTLLITLGGTFISAFLSSFSWHWTVLAFTKFSSALFASGTNAVTYALLGECCPLSHRNSFMLFSSSGLMLSQSLIAIVAFPVLGLSFDTAIPILGLSYRPWRLLAQVLSIFNGIGTILLMVFIWESPKFLVSIGKHEEGLKVLSEIYSTNTGNSSKNYKVKALIIEDNTNGLKPTFLVSIWNQTIPLLQKKHIKNTLLISYICIVVYGTGPPFSVWLPTIFNAFLRSLSSGQENHFCSMIEARPNDLDVANVTEEFEVCDDTVNDLTLIGMTLFGLLLCIICSASVWLVARVGKRWMIVGVHVFCAACSLTLNHVYGVSGLALFILLTCNAICMGMTTAFAVELFPTNLRAMAVCLTIMVGRGVAFISINLIGDHLQNNCENLFYALAGFIFSGAVVGWFLPSDVEKNIYKE